jgi:TonB family protein
MKQQAKNMSPWKLGALSALCALLFIVFACSEEMQTKEIGSQTEVFSAVEEQPEFEGGMPAFYKYVGSEIKYPLQARQKGVEGRVDVQFVVEKDGSLSDVKAIKGIGAGCDSEAVRVVQNAASFKPGSQRGRPVRVRMAISIIFKLNENKVNEDNIAGGIIVLEEVELKNDKLKVDAHYANSEWSDTVYDEQGEGLPGANIMVAGTTTGTASDLDGSFKLKVTESGDLIISFVGYESVRVAGK